MNTKMIAAVAAATMLTLSGCASTGIDRQTAGTVGGAVVGGVLGSAVGGGTIGTVGGAAAGAYIGNQATKPGSNR